MESNEWRYPVTERERKAVIRDVVDKIVEQKTLEAAASPAKALEYIINETLYLEKLRARTEGGAGDAKEELAFLLETTRHLASASDDQKKKMLAEIVGHYAEEIAGHFDKNVFKFSTKLLPIGLTAMFNAFSPSMLVRDLSTFPSLRSRIVIRGDIDHIKRLTKKGTLLVVPTHSSNLDSVVVGWALNEVGLPPLNYGADKGLFTNAVLSFFMNSLGAYMVDRRKKHPLYKEVLKTYSIVILERGYHSLFFPGGTRNRAGSVETKLKLGLLGTGLTAYIDGLIRNRERPNIYIVPLTINYPIVLEAETLMDDYLKEAGKARYIIDDDEFASPFKMSSFMIKLMGMESSMALRFCEPLDPFGNRVDGDGRSIDSKGRPVDIRKYVADAEGKIVHDAARDAEYTRELGDSIVRVYHKNNVVLSTHALAFVLFEMLKRKNPGVDLYRLLRYEGEGARFKIPEVLTELDRLIARLLDLVQDHEIRIGGGIRPGDCSEEVMYEALRFFGAFHTRAVVARKGEKLILNDLNLLLYYHNRLLHYGLEKLFEGGDVHAAGH